jgi:uncharacterized protein with GYD domain
VATYIALIQFTEQGIQKVRETHRRADAFRAMAKQAGVAVQNVYWTLGAFDGVLVLDAPDHAAATAVLLALAAQGNVRTQTLRAFGEAEIDAVLAKSPPAGKK